MRRKISTTFICLIMICTLSGCTKKEYGNKSDAPHVMTIVDEAAGYTIYRHDETGVWYFCRDNGYGKSVVVMVNQDGTPYTGTNGQNETR